jgi:hypothetical protein
LARFGARFAQIRTTGEGYPERHRPFTGLQAEGAMQKLSLSYEEFRAVLRHCRWFPVDRLMRNADLRRYLAGRLRYQAPHTARAVEQMDDEQIEDLRAEIRAHQGRDG